MWSSMINYWHLTGDLTYNGDVVSSLTAQAGNTQDFMGQYTTGNDDQLWRAIAAITAAGYDLPEPASDSTWLQLAENVFSAVQARWDTTMCNGGLGWQISPPAPGYH